ncbi:MAG: hypothetical protein OEZ68_14190 [Gammaproteobacteria bacterium]|nr:hypothetical protein [Gammaproteobacteria bacterium]MDH5801953.1 hypothetical protein [Gammaproteobacteria bacterium]
MNGTPQEYKEHYEDGALKVKGQLLNGTKTGVWSFYKKSGRKVMEAHFSNDGEALFNFYFDQRGSMIEQGHVVVPHTNGQVAEEGLVKNCLKQGLWIYYDKEGHKRIEGEHKNGLKHGLWLYYDINGKLECQGNCRKNQWHGTVTFYHRDGTVKKQLQYHDGKIQSPTEA